jgi:hypothetical protein
MAFLEKHGRTARVFYLNVLYLTMALLSALTCAALNAPYGADDEPRFEQCALGGATAQAVCANVGALTDDEANQNQQLFNISLATAIVNSLLFAWSAVNHFGEGNGIGTHFDLQPLFSIVNIGLFAGLVGWFNATTFATDADYITNLENNVVYSDYDSRAIVVVGLIAGVLDLVLFNALNYFYFKGSCKA